LTMSVLCIYAQKELSMQEVELKLEEIPMSQTNQKYADGKWRYYEKGSSEPFTGILYGKYDNGNLLTRQHFVNGIGEGKWYNYYENGNLREAGTYIQDRVEGPMKKYDENGQVRAEGMYKDWRIRVGKWKYYDANGQLLKIVDHGERGDFRDIEEMYKNGDISKRRYDQLMKS